MDRLSFTVDCPYEAFYWAFLNGSMISGEVEVEDSTAYPTCSHVGYALPLRGDMIYLL